MSRRTITLLGWIVIPIGIVLAFISSYWLTIFLFSRTFTSWKSLGSPPTGVATIVDAGIVNIWVETKNGQLFTTNLICSKNEVCKEWVEVDSISEITISHFTPIKRSDSCEKLVTEELPRNPDGIMTDCVLAISPGFDYDLKTYYAVMPDGSIKYWRYDRNDYGSIYFCILSNVILSSIVVLIFIKIRKKFVT